jgi:hypothetical protein
MTKGGLAACLALREQDGRALIADLENNENYCAKAAIPVSGDAKPALLLSDLQIEDGIVFAFGG